MDYIKQLSEIRNKMHCDIVQEATVRTMVNIQTTDGVLSLEKSIQVGDYVVQSICCETGLLISIEDRVVRYQDLTVEDLSVLHREFVLGKHYSFKSNKQLV